MTKKGIVTAIASSALAMSCLTGCSASGHYDKTEYGFAEALWNFYDATKQGNYTEALLWSDVSEYFDGTTDLAEAYPLFTDADLQSICEAVIAEYDCSKCHNVTYIHEKDKAVSYDCDCEKEGSRPFNKKLGRSTEGNGFVAVDDEDFWSFKTSLCVPKDSTLEIDGKVVEGSRYNMEGSGKPADKEAGEYFYVKFPNSTAEHTYTCTLASGGVYWDIYKG